MRYKVWTKDGRLVCIYDTSVIPRESAWENDYDMTQTTVEHRLRQVVTKGAGIITEYQYVTKMEEGVFHRFIALRHRGDGEFTPKVELIMKDPGRGYKVFLLQEFTYNPDEDEEYMAVKKTG